MYKQIDVNDIRAFASGMADGEEHLPIFIRHVVGSGSFSEVLQLNFMFFLFCKAGCATLQVNGQEVALKGGDLFIGLADMVLEKGSSSADADIFMVIMSRDFFSDSVLGLQRLWPYLLYIGAHPVLHLSRAEQAQMEDYSAVYARRVGNADYKYLYELSQSLARIFVCDVCSFLSRRNVEVARLESRQYAIFDRFISLLRDNCTAHRSVEWYSEALCLSSKYLSEVAKQVSGKPASYWINAMVLMEIKLLLRKTSLSVKEIATRMNFSNQSFMGKYFKHATGMSPLRYRRS